MGQKKKIACSVPLKQNVYNFKLLTLHFCFRLSGQKIKVMFLSIVFFVMWCQLIFL